MTAKENDMHTINPETLKQRRKARGWSLDDLADESKINRSTISRIERGATSRQSRHTISELAKTLACTAEELASPPDAEDGDSLLAVIRPRSKPKLKMSDAAQNALHLVAMRYGVRPEEVLDFAPLLFDIAAMESLSQRRAKLNELNAQIAKLQDMSREFPHLSEELTGRWGDSDCIERIEDESIRSLDVQGLLIEPIDNFVDPRPLDADSESVNPFVLFLNDRIAQIAERVSGWNAKVNDWCLGSPNYRICEAEAASFAAGDDGVAESVLDGDVRIIDLPPSLRTADKKAERLDWLHEQIEAYRERLNIHLDKHFPDLKLPNPLLGDFGIADGEGKE